MGLMCWISLRDGLLFHSSTDVDDIVSGDTKADPAFHSDEALVAATIEAMSPFDHADTALGPGAPFLAVAELALSLLSAQTPRPINFALGSRLGARDVLAFRGSLAGCWRSEQFNRHVAQNGNRANRDH
jgi:hypothetical protein